MVKTGPSDTRLYPAGLPSDPLPLQQATGPRAPMTPGRTPTETDTGDPRNDQKQKRRKGKHWDEGEEDPQVTMTMTSRATDQTRAKRNRPQRGLQGLTVFGEFYRPAEEAGGGTGLRDRKHQGKRKKNKQNLFFLLFTCIFFKEPGKIFSMSHQRSTSHSALLTYASILM